MTGLDVTLYSGENVIVGFVYSGPLPLSSDVEIFVRDAVTNYNLCFSSQRSIPVSISSSTEFWLT